MLSKNGGVIPNTILNQMTDSIPTICKLLVESKVILYPTDTVWGLGGDATDTNVVEKIYALKKRKKEKSLICLMKDWEMLSNYIPNPPELAKSLFENAERPTTIIFKNPVGLPSNLVASDNTIAIRIPKHTFCQALLKEFNKPIISTSANISDTPTPAQFSEIDKPILEGVDYIVNIERDKIAHQSSKIIFIKDTKEIITIRP